MAPEDKIKLYCDKQSALLTMKNDVVSNRAKHIDIKYLYIRDVIKEGKAEVDYCATDLCQQTLLRRRSRQSVSGAH